jgi:RimJ/RimL family protein N-acetyltransferase
MLPHFKTIIQYHFIVYVNRIQSIKKRGTIYVSNIYIGADFMTKTDRFILRQWQDCDAQGLADIANNKKIYDNLRDAFPHPYSLEDAKQYISNVKNSDTLFAVIIDNKVAGSVGVFIKDDVYRKSAEIGYYLAEEYWGRGLMTEIIKEVVKFTFENFDIVRIYAEPFARNKGSRRVLEKAGFRLEGILKNSIIKNDIIEDSCVYAILKE